MRDKQAREKKSVSKGKNRCIIRKLLLRVVECSFLFVVGYFVIMLTTTVAMPYCYGLIQGLSGLNETSSIADIVTAWWMPALFFSGVIAILEVLGLRALARWVHAGVNKHIAQIKASVDADEKEIESNEN